MIDILQSILAFIVALGVLITFHEFGHYWVARKCDVKILRFSIGFGRPMYKRIFGPDKTEFVIASLPLGGYVKMLDSREAEVQPEEQSREFNQKPLWQRFAIVAAGPAFNFIFAIIAYALIYMIGVDGLKPIVGEVTPASISAEAGLQQGQEIIAVDNVKTPTWTAVIDRLVNHTVSADQVSLDVIDKAGGVQTISLDMSRISIDEMAEGNLLQALGMKVVELKLEPVIGEIISGGAADMAGMKAMDKVIAVDGKAVGSWTEWVEIIRDSPGQSMNVELLRNDVTQFVTLVPSVNTVNGTDVGRIGAVAYKPEGFFEDYFTLESYAVTTSLVKAVEKTWDMSLLTLRVLGKMLIGEASVKNLSGPISIAQYAGQTADIGLIAFLGFMAIVSVSLGVLNLLPVPLLDGGHLVYYVIEFMIGKPVSESIQVWGQQMGLVLLLSLMSLAFYNDIIRLLG
ncbi:MAG: RIP metalloprotease RseP [Gammaproteobacteria bacterium]